ncbi:MAG: type II secretion system F family protein [Nanopusillaceae archaeon]
MMKNLIFLAIIIALILIFMFIFNFPISKAILNGTIIGLLPYLIYQEINNRIEKEKEENFTRFLEDLIDLLKSGLSLPVALEEIEKTDYGRINSLIRNLSARINWGISVEESLLSFAEESNNRTIKRSIKSLIDIYKSGGNLEKSLEAVLNSLLEVKKIKEARRTAIHENIVDSFLVFVFFLGIVFTFEVFLLPFLSIELPGQAAKFIDMNFINELIYNLSIIEAISAGLAMGKMYENSYKAGAKYVLIFLLMVLILFNFIIPLVPKGAILINIT